MLVYFSVFKHMSVCKRPVDLSQLNGVRLLLTSDLLPLVIARSVGVRRNEVLIEELIVVLRVLGSVVVEVLRYRHTRWRVVYPRVAVLVRARTVVTRGRGVVDARRLAPLLPAAGGLLLPLPLCVRRLVHRH